MKNRERCEEISEKIYKMAHALIKEGDTLNEATISDLGTMMGILASTFLIPKEHQFFVDIFDMYSAKQIILSTNKGDLDGFSEEGFTGDDPTSNE